MTSDQLFEGYVTRDELAAKLGVSKRTILNYEAMPDGLPSLTFARRKFYKIDSVARWIASRETTRNPRRKRV